MSTLRAFIPALALAGVLTIPVPAGAAVVFTLLPGSGAINGLPGQTPGWGFTLSNDTVDWILISGIDFAMDKDPSWGAFTDFSANSPAVGPGTPANPMVLTMLYDLLDQTGAGGFAIGLTSPFFDQAHVTLTLNYDLYDADPDHGGNYQGSDSSVAQGTVFIPEPGISALLALGLGGVAAARRRARRLRPALPGCGGPRGS